MISLVVIRLKCSFHYLVAEKCLDLASSWQEPKALLGLHKWCLYRADRLDPSALNGTPRCQCNNDKLCRPAGRSSAYHVCHQAELLPTVKFEPALRL